MILGDERLIGGDEVRLRTQRKHFEESRRRKTPVHVVDLPFPFDFHGKFITHWPEVVKGTTRRPLMLLNMEEGGLWRETWGESAIYKTVD